MALEEVIGNAGIEALKVMPPQFLENFAGVLRLAQAIGIAFIVYVLFLIVRGIFRWRDSLKLQKIVERLDSINHKLALIIKKDKKFKK